jgi:hypothetical protein
MKASSKPKPAKPVPMGKALRWTDKQHEAEIVFTDADVQRAIEVWNETSGLPGLLEAKTISALTGEVKV